MEAEAAIRPAIRHLVDGVTAILERVAPLRPVFDAAAAEEGVARVWERGERLRLEGYRTIIEILARKGALRAGHDLDTATDVLFVLLGPDTFRAFVEGRRWKLERWKTWVAATLEHELFKSSR